MLHVHHYAVGGTDEMVELYSVDEEFSSGVISPFPDQKLKSAEVVQGVTLKKLLRNLDIDRVTLLKVDIEGAEFDMFDSTDDETLRRLDQITIEFHDFANPELLPRVHEIISRMETLGYWCIKFTRHFHGDVVFLNPEQVKLSRVEFLWAKYVIRDIRGLRRMLGR